MSISKAEEKELEVKNAPQDDMQDVVDIDLKEIQKKRFRLDRDNARVIELNTSDLSAIKRLEEIYPKMLKFVDEAHANIQENPGTEMDELLSINQQMKDLLNWAFDSDVADKACPSGTLYDLINGKFRFEYIMEKLIGLYDANLTNEFNLMKKRLNRHTAKYTKKTRK